MDPITLFAMANGAVAAIKKGCQLYKDIKGAAGNVKEVLDDLDKQFHNLHKDKPPTPEQRKQLQEKKNEVIELNKKKGETDDVYTMIGEHLGNYFDAYNKCKMAIEEEERHSKEELYTGDDSIAKRALQRVLMKKKLEQMGTELRETVVYQSPPELGALWTDVNAMMDQVFKEQKVHLQKKMRMDQAEARRKEKWKRQLKADAYFGGLILILMLFCSVMFTYIAHDAQKRYPDLMSHTNQYRYEALHRKELLEQIEKSQNIISKKPEQDDD
jgi:hypothetical protein